MMKNINIFILFYLFNIRYQSAYAAECNENFLIESLIPASILNTPDGKKLAECIKDLHEKYNVDQCVKKFCILNPTFLDANIKNKLDKEYTVIIKEIGNDKKVYISAKENNAICTNFKYIEEFISLDRNNSFARVSTKRSDHVIERVNDQEFEILNIIKEKFNDSNKISGLPNIYSINKNENGFEVDLKWYNQVRFNPEGISNISKQSNDKKLLFIKGITLGVGNLLSLKYIHEDLKADNFLYDENFNGVVIDFGLVSNLEYIKDESIKGTPYYFSPFKHEYNDKNYSPHRTSNDKIKDLVFELSLSLLEVVDSDLFKIIYPLYEKCYKDNFKTSYCKNSEYLNNKNISNISRMLIKNLKYNRIERMDFRKFNECISRLSESDFVQISIESVQDKENCFTEKIVKPSNSKLKRAPNTLDLRNKIK